MRGRLIPRGDEEGSPILAFPQRGEGKTPTGGRKRRSEGTLYGYSDFGEPRSDRGEQELDVEVEQLGGVEAEHLALGVVRDVGGGDAS